MKNLIRFALYFLFVMSFSSCLKMGLDDLPTLGKADITNVKFEYRWWDEAASQLRVIELTTEKEIIGHTINCTITVPSTTTHFTSAIREKVALSNIVCITDISAGATIRPTNGAPTLGVPGDFSGKAFSYLVIAADGSEIEWNINIIALNN